MDHAARRYRATRSIVMHDLGDQTQCQHRRRGWQRPCRDLSAGQFAPQARGRPVSATRCRRQVLRLPVAVTISRPALHCDWQFLGGRQHAFERGVRKRKFNGLRRMHGRLRLGHLFDHGPWLRHSLRLRLWLRLRLRLRCLHCGRLGNFFRGSWRRFGRHRPRGLRVGECVAHLGHVGDGSGCRRQRRRQRLRGDGLLRADRLVRRVLGDQNDGLESAGALIWEPVR